MKIDTAEEYKALQERRRVGRVRRHARDYMRAVFDRQGQTRALDHGMKPNHHLRTQSIGMITEAMVRPHKKDEEVKEDEA